MERFRSGHSFRPALAVLAGTALALVAIAADAPVAGAASVFVRPHNSVAVLKRSTLPANALVPYESTTVTLGDTETLRLTGLVSFTNQGKAIVHLTLMPEVDTQAVGSVESVTIAAKSSTTVAIAAWATGVAQGQHVMAVVGKADGTLRLNGATLFGLGLPPGDNTATLPNSATGMAGPISVGTTAFTQVESDSFTNTTTTNIAVDGWAGLSNSGTAPATVSLRYTLDGKTTGDGSWLTLAPGASLVDPFAFGCVNIVAGKHTLGVELLSTTTGVTATAGAIGGMGLPSGPTSPIPLTEAYGPASITDVNLYQGIVTTTQDSSGVGAIANATDTEGSAWVTLENPSAKASTISLQALTNGSPEPDAPVLLATLSGHSQLTIPAAGFVCNEMPIGITTMGVQIKSTLAGVQVQVTDQRLIAWASPATP